MIISQNQFFDFFWESCLWTSKNHPWQQMRIWWKFSNPPNTGKSSSWAVPHTCFIYRSCLGTIAKAPIQTWHFCPCHWRACYPALRLPPLDNGHSIFYVMSIFVIVSGFVRSKLQMECPFFSFDWRWMHWAISCRYQMAKHPFCGDMVQLAIDMNDVCYSDLVASDLIGW